VRKGIDFVILIKLTCKIKNWKKRSQNRADWEKSIKEVKVCIGL
jgi:hypothetical protein